MKKEETVKLKQGGVERDFPMPQALNILRRESTKSKKDYELVDKAYKFENNELVKRAGAQPNQ